MTEKFEILGKYIKDLSSETPDIETYLFVKERISKYQLGIDISSKAVKNKLVEIYTTFNHFLYCTPLYSRKIFDKYLYLYFS